ncbi:hypothetical protein GSI_01005 [Ganoderma sinense ZZ0214-1]|uniref:Uncharacterized protein n=1 Tax=Ganoderma sinense ZZ0214-1 TaxID=1077348 RepID=A0A2G8SUA3_9APHY|nr:hypothetical protein GSI_01005 [Ganoderma sinense ZZ0214-1]
MPIPSSQTPPPAYGSTVHEYHIYEHTPLNGTVTRKAARPRRSICACLARTVVLLTFIYLAALLAAQNFSLIPLLTDDIPLEEKNAVRREWRREQQAHEHEVAKWNGERAAHLRDMRAWQNELEALHRKRDQWMRDVEAERTQWAAEHREEELHRKEIERKRQGVHWSAAWGSNSCVAYGTRSYNAYLLDIPAELNWYEVCADMPNKFHGLWVDKPATCQRDRNGVWATWFVDFDEPQCVTYWDTLHDLVYSLIVKSDAC